VRENKVVVTCPSCSKKYRLEDKHFQGKDRYRFSCPSCKQPIEAVRPASPAEQTTIPPPPPLPPPPPSTQRIKKEDLPQQPLQPGLVMPAGKRLSLAVLQGADAGQLFPIEKPLMVIGRSEADVVLNDSEVSRRHAQIEIAGNAVLLRDLHSTNGTYVNEQRITSTPLEHQVEFRVGTTTMMLIVTDETP
jgi:hypothetical protein